ncbi:MAG: hypothetical protein Q8P97_01455 [bacterium]|nr:hypothetical protein [bacterium]
MNGDENKFPIEKIIEKPLESDMERLAREVKEVQKQPEFKSAAPKEVIKQSLKSFGGSATTATDDKSAPPDDAALLPNYMQSENEATQEELERLVEISIRDGFEVGISKARERGSFMVDAIHDALAEKVYPELKRRGILE